MTLLPHPPMEISWIPSFLFCIRPSWLAATPPLPPSVFLSHPQHLLPVCFPVLFWLCKPSDIQSSDRDLDGCCLEPMETQFKSGAGEKWTICELDPFPSHCHPIAMAQLSLLAHELRYSVILAFTEIGNTVITPRKSCLLNLISKNFVLWISIL